MKTRDEIKEDFEYNSKEEKYVFKIKPIEIILTYEAMEMFKIEGLNELMVDMLEKNKANLVRAINRKINQYKKEEENVE